MTIPMITFVGRSNSGKTTLLVKLIAELKRRGYRIATIKHHSHSAFEADQPGKDSYRHAEAGSEHVMVIAPHKMASYRTYEHEPSLEEIVAGVAGVDILLIEGYKQAPSPTIEVVRAANSLDLVGRPEYRIAIATDAPLEADVPMFALNDIMGIADFIEARFLRPAVRNGPHAGHALIDFDTAYRLTLAHIAPLPDESAALLAACGRILAEDLDALVDSPSVNASLKDGYAVRSADIAGATPDHPVRLRIAGTAAAGQAWAGDLQQGATIRVLTGAPLPHGADAIVSSEFTTDDGDTVVVTNHAEPSRNVLARGSDTSRGQRIASAGTLLQPSVLGLLAAAGYERVPVVRRPRVAILATGDEVLAPGQPLQPGKLYASNLVTLAAWCVSNGMSVTTALVPDRAEDIRARLLAATQEHDAILTSGGAWKGERDLVVRLLDDLGWEKVYHRVRIGPGKAVGFGLLRGKPVFCLPGGPPSNLMAFLQFALPGLHRLQNRLHLGLPRAFARLAAPVGGPADWTQFVYGRLHLNAGAHLLEFHPLREKSRLQEMAGADALVMIPAGTELIPAGAIVEVQLLSENRHER